MTSRWTGPIDRKKGKRWQGQGPHLLVAVALAGIHGAISISMNGANMISTWQVIRPCPGAASGRTCVPRPLGAVRGGESTLQISSGGVLNGCATSPERTMVRRDDIVTAEQCVGHAEAAMEEEEFEDAVDFLHAAFEDIEDEYGEDSVESVPLLLIYSKALKGLALQHAAASKSSGDDVVESSRRSDDRSAPEDSQEPEEAAPAAWTALQDVRRISKQKLDRETKEVAEAHELLAQFVLEPELTCPALVGKTPKERLDLAVEHLSVCLRIRGQLFHDSHHAVQRVRATLKAVEEKCHAHARTQQTEKT